MADIDVHRRNIVYAVVIGTAIVSSTAVVLRFISRGSVVRLITIDDWLMLGSLIFLLAYTATETTSAVFGLGLHIWDVENITENLPIIVQLILADGSLYHASMYCAKCSILSFYIHLVPVETKTRKACWATILFLSLQLVANILGFTLSCIPVTKGWNPAVPGQCIDMAAYLFVGASLNIITDVVIVVLPISWLARVKRPRKQRYLLIGLFGFSIVGTMISCARLPAIASFSPTSDPTWDFWPLAIWSHLELMTIIVVASVPAIKPLFEKCYVETKSLMTLTSKSSPTMVESGGENDLTRFYAENMTNKSVVTISAKRKAEKLELSKGFYDLSRPKSVGHEDLGGMGWELVEKKGSDDNV